MPIALKVAERVCLSAGLFISINLIYVKAKYVPNRVKLQIMVVLNNPDIIDSDYRVEMKVL